VNQPAIHTERCVLEPLDIPTARALAAGRWDAVPGGPGWPHPDTAVVVSAALSLGWPTWLIRCGPADGAVIGECGLKGAPEPGGPVEIGYGLAGPARGHGYAREAVAALLGWLAEDRQATAVLAEVKLTNTASRRLVEGLGFTLDEERDGFAHYRLPLPR